MANETQALMGQPPTDRVAEDDYQSFCTALGSSARGRAFLTEYARRNRHADTEVVLAALSRFEQAARSQKAEPEADRIRQDLRALLDTLRGARPQIDNSPGAVKSATLAALIDFAQARIEAMVTKERGPLSQVSLAQVPDLDQPELPIPQPASAALPPITLVQSAATPPAFDSKRAEFALSPEKQPPATGKNFSPLKQSQASGIIPEVNFVDDSISGKATDNAAPKPSPAETSGATKTVTPPAFEFLPPATRMVIPAVEPSETAKQDAAPKAPTESYEIWLDPRSEIQIDVEIDSPTGVQANWNIDAQTDAPIVTQAATPFAPQIDAPIVWPTAAKPTAVSPRQAAIAALAAQSEVQQPAADKPPASAAVATQPAEKPAALSPRQAAIAALAAQSEVQQPTADKPTAPAPVANQPSRKTGALSPRQAAIAALAAQSEAQQPTVDKPPATAPAATQPTGKTAAQSPRQTAIAALAAQSAAQQPGAVKQAAPAATVSQPAQPATDPLAVIMALSEDERMALFT